MNEFFEQELELKNFLFHHKRPIIFVTAQFGPPVVYPAWLAIQLLYHMIALLIDGIQTAKHDSEPTGNYFLYLTNWSYLLLVISNIVDLSITLYVHCLERYMLEERETEKADAEIVMRNKAVRISYKTMGKFYGMKKYLMVNWAFFTLSTVVGLTVTLLYGTLALIRAFTDLNFNLLGVRIGENNLEFGTLAFAYINSIVIVIHIFISAKPFRLLHFYLPMLFFFVYTLFTINYQVFGESDRYIYTILDWDDDIFRTTGIAYGAIFIVVPLVHLLVYGLIQARTKFGTWFRIRHSFSKWKKTKIRPAETEIDPETNVIRWLGANNTSRKEKSSAVISVVPSSSRATSPRAETASLKSETSL